jgi:hypothetical protein
MVGGPGTLSAAVGVFFLHDKAENITANKTNNR